MNNFFSIRKNPTHCVGIILLEKITRNFHRTMNLNIDTKPDYNYILLSIPTKPLLEHAQIWWVFLFLTMKQSL